jgi:hypothetical protein
MKLQSLLQYANGSSTREGLMFHGRNCDELTVDDQNDFRICLQEPITGAQLSACPPSSRVVYTKAIS